MTSIPTPPGEALAITPEDLLVVLADLWEATFGSGVAPVAASDSASDPSPWWWASVDLLDDDGVVAEVILAVDEPALAAVAKLTFGVGDPEPDQMIDVAAEAANIIGGNVKGILALGTRLSAPRAGTGAPPVGSAPRTSLHAVDDRGRHVTVHVVHVVRAVQADTAGDGE